MDPFVSPLARAVWWLVEQREQAIASRMAMALDEHVRQVRAIDVDDLATLIPLCTPQAYLKSIANHAQAVLADELVRREALVGGLRMTPPPLDAPAPQVPEALQSLLVAPLRALRDSIDQSAQPIRALHDFVKDPNATGAVGRRLASRAAGQAFGGFVGVAVAIVGGLIAAEGKKKRMRAFARRIKEGPPAVRERWLAIPETHRDQARRVSDHLYLQSLEPLILAVHVRGDRAALSTALREAAA